MIDFAQAKKRINEITGRYVYEKIDPRVCQAIVNETSVLLDDIIRGGEPGWLKQEVTLQLTTEMNVIRVNMHPLTDRAEDWLLSFFKGMNDVVEQDTGR